MAEARLAAPKSGGLRLAATPGRIGWRARCHHLLCGWSGTRPPVGRALRRRPGCLPRTRTPQRRKRMMSVGSSSSPRQARISQRIEPADEVLSGRSVLSTVGALRLVAVLISHWSLPTVGWVVINAGSSLGVFSACVSLCLSMRANLN